MGRASTYIRCLAFCISVFQSASALGIQSLGATSPGSQLQIHWTTQATDPPFVDLWELCPTPGTDVQLATGVPTSSLSFSTVVPQNPTSKGSYVCLIAATTPGSSMDVVGDTGDITINVGSDSQPPPNTPPATHPNPTTPHPNPQTTIQAPTLAPTLAPTKLPGTTSPATNAPPDSPNAEPTNIAGDHTPSASPSLVISSLSSGPAHPNTPNSSGETQVTSLTSSAVISIIHGTDTITLSPPSAATSTGKTTHIAPAIAGGVGGGLFLLALMLAAFFYLRLRRRRRNRATPTPTLVPLPYQRPNSQRPEKSRLLGEKSAAQRQRSESRTNSNTSTPYTSSEKAVAQRQRSELLTNSSTSALYTSPETSPGASSTSEAQLRQQIRLMGRRMSELDSQQRHLNTSAPNTSSESSPVATSEAQLREQIRFMSQRMSELESQRREFDRLFGDVNEPAPPDYSSTPGPRNLIS